MLSDCTLQINLAPSDYLHARHILPHQLKILAGQVKEVLLVIDTHKSKGRFGANWEDNRAKMYELLTMQVAQYTNARIAEVDYTDHTVRKIAEFFFGRQFIPSKDFRGGPFYAYFYGIYESQHNCVLHLDADILLGGGSDSWVSEAVDLLNANADVFCTSPLPGPPHAAGILVGQPDAARVGAYRFSFSGMSTRLFMMRKDRFQQKKLQLLRPMFKEMLKAIIRGHPVYDLPEHIFSHYMRKNGLQRVDFLGKQPGLWSLHPPYRNDLFYNTLPELLRRINNADLPASQYGFYDIGDDLVDWSSARAKFSKRKWYFPLN